MTLRTLELLTLPMSPALAVLVGLAASPRVAQLPGLPCGLKVIIADVVNERRKRLAALAERMVQGRIVAHQTDSGLETLQLAADTDANLILLHSELADSSGLDVFLKLPGAQRRQVVLVASSPQVVERAFEAGVEDCLLQPVTFEALAIAVLRNRCRLRSSPVAAPNSLLRTYPVQREEPSVEHAAAGPLLVGEREHRLYPLDPSRIEYIESAGNYVKYHVGAGEYIARESIKHLEARLHPRGFLRIERCLLVNIRAIAYAEPFGQATFAFTLLSGAQLHSGPAYRDTILQILPLRRRPSTRGGQRPHPLNTNCDMS